MDEVEIVVTPIGGSMDEEWEKTKPSAHDRFSGANKMLEMCS